MARRIAAQSADPSLLEALREKAFAFRSERTSPKQRFPDEIKALVIQALDAGHQVTDVSAAAGADRSVVGKWRREAGAGVRRSERRRGVRELRIIREPENGPALVG